jgi:hypothetical protein
MVVEHHQQTLVTVAIVKNSDTDVATERYCNPYFDGHFYEQLGPVLSSEKVDQIRDLEYFCPSDYEKLEKVQYNNTLLVKENETLLDFNAA